MTLEQLEERIGDLERQVAELRSERKSLAPLRSTQETFGMFADDAGFDEVVRLGRDYRNRANGESQ